MENEQKNQQEKIIEKSAEKSAEKKEKKLPFAKEFISDVTDMALFVKTSEDDIFQWDKEKISDSLIKETGADLRVALEIADEIETFIKQNDLKFVSAPLIRELVNVKLIEKGLEGVRKAYTRLGVPLYDVGKIIMLEKNKDNANVPHGPEATNLTIAERVKKEYALLVVFSNDVADAHASGEIHLHDLGMVDRPYSFFRNEILTVKNSKGEIWVLPFEQLFNKIKEPIIEENGFEIKKTKGFSVLDENGWVGLQKIVRHKAEKPLLAINSSNGKSVVVTSDHPFIKSISRADILQCPKCGSKDVIKNGGVKNDTRSCLCKKCNKSFRSSIQKIDLSKRKSIEAGKITERDFVFTPSTKTKFLKDKDIFNEEMAWLVGYFIAEGFYGKNEVAIRVNFQELEKVRKILKKNSISYRGNEDRIRIYSKQLRETLEVKLGIRQYAQNKTMPFNFMEYSEKIIAAIVSGVVDGDGSVRSDNYVSEVLLRMTSKALLSQIQTWFDNVGIRSYLSSIDGYGVRIYQGKTIEGKLPLFCLRFYLDEKQKKIFKFSEKINNDNFKPARTKKDAEECSQVRKIDEISNDDEYVYDVTTETGTFISSGVLVHNCSGQSLEYVKKFGLDLTSSLAQAKPAKNPAVLLAHLLKFSAALQCHFSGAIGWDAVNLFFAPYLEGMSDVEVKQLAQMLIFEFSQQSVARGGQAIFSDINLYWEVPKHFEKVRAIGPGGKFTGKTYGEYEKDAQRFILALFEVYKEGDAMGRPFFFPKPLLHITEKFFRTEGHEKFLEIACDLAADKGSTYFVFDRGETAKISQCCRLAFKLEPEDLIDALEPWKMRYSAIQNITINLPRIAYKAKKDEKVLFTEMDRVMELVVRAHRQKHLFMEYLFNMGTSGPLGFLSIKRDERPYYRIHKASHLIGMVGLNEMVKAHMGEEMHESKEAFKFGIKVIAYMNLATKRLSEQYKMKFVLEQTPAETTAYRFAKLDLKWYPYEATQVVQGNIDTDEIYYTNSTLLNVGAEIDPIERVRQEGILHPLIEAGSISHIWLGEAKPSAKSIANLIKKIFYNTTNDQVAFSPEFTACNECGRIIRGIQDNCSYCGSSNLDIITRVTGYFSRVSMWNKGKIAELKDRNKAVNQGFFKSNG
ncbi:anaerobic ribonucleoside-triphosphate reductase [bacterium]|nr:MAG: anaerobic ribonucleoside-triphosphate reductase [bacterium]